MSLDWIYERAKAGDLPSLWREMETHLKLD